VRIATLSVFGVWFAFGQQAGTIQQPETTAIASTSQPAAPSWETEILNWPVVRFFASLFTDPATLPVPSGGEAPAPSPRVAMGACSVPPLVPITDPTAQALEARDTPDGDIDVNDMIPAAAHALDLFESKVEAVGGSIELKSAYRPAAYQAHLQDVWYKWMELKNNHDPGCQDLRAQVQEEFLRHHLIESQHPVTVSDHTRGLAFDATVALPQHARIGRHFFTLDSLARLAGLLRPAIASDPVHFKYVGAVLASARSFRRAAIVRVASVRRIRKLRVTHFASVRRHRNLRAG
jgi:hypothetical protein